MLFADLDRTQWTVDRLLVRAADAYADRAFLQMVGTQPQTYAEVLASARRVATGLSNVGVRGGDAVVIMLPNSFEAVHAWFGINLIGGIEVSINPAYRGQTLEHALNTAQAKVMIIDAEYLPVLNASMGNVPYLETVVVLDKQRQGADSADPIVPKASLSYNQLIDGPGDANFSGPRFCDIASVIYTSGTTGPSKGVMMPHAQVILLACMTAKNTGLRTDDISYCFYPLHHMAGKFMSVLAIMTVGGKIVLDNGFAPEQWLPRIREYEATVTGAHGPMLEMVFALQPSDDDKRHKLRSVRTAPFPRRIARAFEQRFGVKGIEVWGMTEIGVPCWSPLHEPLREGSCGKVDSEWYEFRVVDPETDEPLESGQIGEFMVRPKWPWSTMQGYMGMPDKTVAAWRNLWFHTGDAGYQDHDGYVYFVDRTTERIRRRAENISSQDIEAAALLHPLVAAAAAVGVPSEYANDDDIKLCIVRHGSAVLSEVDLLTHLVAHLPHYMVPRYIEFLHDLPRTATNKIKRAALKAAPYGIDVWDRKAAGISIRELAQRGRLQFS